MMRHGVHHSALKNRIIGLPVSAAWRCWTRIAHWELPAAEGHPRSTSAHSRRGRRATQHCCQTQPVSHLVGWFGHEVPATVPRATMAVSRTSAQSVSPRVLCDSLSGVPVDAVAIASEPEVAVSPLVNAPDARVDLGDEPTCTMRGVLCRQWQSRSRHVPSRGARTRRSTRSCLSWGRRLIRPPQGNAPSRSTMSASLTITAAKTRALSLDQATCRPIVTARVPKSVTCVSSPGRPVVPERRGEPLAVGREGELVRDWWRRTSSRRARPPCRPPRSARCLLAPEPERASGCA